jgi:hypothetical protein
MRLPNPRPTAAPKYRNAADRRAGMYEIEALVDAVGVSEWVISPSISILPSISQSTMRGS